MQMMTTHAKFNEYDILVHKCIKITVGGVRFKLLGVIPPPPNPGPQIFASCLLMI